MKRYNDAGKVVCIVSWSRIEYRMQRHENIYNLQVRIIKYSVYTHDRGLSFGFGLNVSIISDDLVKINLNTVAAE